MGPIRVSRLCNLSGSLLLVTRLLESLLGLDVVVPEESAGSIKLPKLGNKGLIVRMVTFQLYNPPVKLLSAI